MDELLISIAAKKERLDAMRPVSREALLALQKSYDVDLTYTSCTQRCARIAEFPALSALPEASVQSGVHIGKAASTPGWRPRTLSRSLARLRRPTPAASGTSLSAH
jgi:hypothetical protein